MSIISQNISQIHDGIQKASATNASPEKITLVAVSKGQNFNKIIEAFDVAEHQEKLDKQARIDAQEKNKQQKS